MCVFMTTQGFCLLLFLLLLLLVNDQPDRVSSPYIQKVSGQKFCGRSGFVKLRDREREKRSMQALEEKKGRQRERKRENEN